jgi:hypothetical protein
MLPQSDVAGITAFLEQVADELFDEFDDEDDEEEDAR